MAEAPIAHTATSSGAWFGAIVLAVVASLFTCPKGKRDDAGTPTSLSHRPPSAEDRAEELRRTLIGTLEIQGIEGRFDGDRWLRVRGRVFNHGTFTVDRVRVEAAITDAGGNVIGREWTYATRAPLRAREEASFEILARRPSGAKSFTAEIVDAALATRTGD
jgi:hypothetical protein